MDLILTFILIFVNFNLLVYGTQILSKKNKIILFFIEHFV